MERLVGVIPAAGKGVRARPYTNVVPKCLLEIDGAPNIERNLALMRDELGITKIFIVVGHLGDMIRAHVGDGSRFGVSVEYIDNDALERGLAWSIYLASGHVDTHFCVILSDECYVNSNHRELRESAWSEAIATCGLLHVDDRELIQRNYAVELEGDRITRLIEKPAHVPNDLLGTGTFILGTDALDELGKAFERSESGYVEFVTFLDELCQRGERVKAFELDGTYVNINDRDSLFQAKYEQRNLHFEEQEITLLLYSEGDEKQIGFTIDRYAELAIFDHVAVVLREENEVAERILARGARPILCPPSVTQIGEMIHHAMSQLSGDIVVIADSDYSFPQRDVLKLLAYMREADMVVGTRTTRQLVGQGSNMRGPVRVANILLAKMLEVLWWSSESRFTDAGCLFRSIWKSSYQAIEPRLDTRGPGYNAEMCIELLCRRDRVIEVPVNYMNRVHSTYRKYQTGRTFFSILGTIFRKRIQHTLQRRNP